ncbi:zinc finger CCCH-type antiviral protein 1-like [Sardina pilchardus]|uniref:zinc finger CCCH-type antiviral protein 1-like n=1 Tax=Sardina pilchardus TaxID=27697 RepID=UPI002E113744
MASQYDSSGDQLNDGELFKWQLNGGISWMDIANDLIIEAQYSKPYTGGITLHNTPMGAISIDFQLMQVRHGGNVQVRRLSSPQATWIWYFKSEEGWSPFGETVDSQGRCTKVSSSTLETEYQKNQQGSYRFNFSSYTYEIRFRDMHQENLRTGCRREVRRRPCFPASQSPVQVALTHSVSGMSLLESSGTPKWQFSGTGNRWHDFQHRVGTNFECSTDSVLIEAEYRKNSQGSMTFTVSGQSYLLDFATMTQANTSIGTVRKVRRV